jgi:hypothetical protein
MFTFVAGWRLTRTPLALETESGFHSLRIRVESGLHPLATMAMGNSSAHTAVLG